MQLLKLLILEIIYSILSSIMGNLKELFKNIGTKFGLFFRFIIPDDIARDESAVKKLGRIILLVILFLFIQVIFIIAVVFFTVKATEETVKLPNVVGQNMYEGITLLQNEGFNLNIEVQYFPEYAEKIIVVQLTLFLPAESLCLHS